MIHSNVSKSPVFLIVIICWLSYQPLHASERSSLSSIETTVITINESLKIGRRQFPLRYLYNRQESLLRLSQPLTNQSSINAPNAVETARNSMFTRLKSISKNDNLMNHGGSIMSGAVTRNIFWGKSWGNYSGDQILGLDLFCYAFGNSIYANNTVKEYVGSNGAIGNRITHLGHVIDTSEAASGENHEAVIDEVCKLIVDPDSQGNGFYAVFSDIPRGNFKYCAFHSCAYCGTTIVQYAYFWKLDDDPACDVHSNIPNRSSGLATLANLWAHEFSEARTNPRIDAWMDARGLENGDKCAWAFKSPYITLSDGSQWKVQGEWSNRAYLERSGFANHLKQKGCIDGS